MKRNIGVVIATILMLVPNMAMAKDFCVSIGAPTGLVFKNFSVPGKGTCKFLVEVNPGFPGLLASGSACTTTDGKTLLFNLTDGFFTGIEAIQGAITLASGTGTASDCNASDSEINVCSQFVLAVEPCPKKPVPIAAPSPDAGPPLRSQLGR